MKRSLLSVACLVAAVAQAEPHIQSEKMPPGPNQPEEFAIIAGSHHFECDAVKVKTTGTVQMVCDIEDLGPGTYLLTVIASKPSNTTETRKIVGTLKVSLRFGGRTYQGARIYNTSYTLVALP